jgi:hypothetical protein
MIKRVGRLGPIFFNGAEKLERTGEIFRVKPAAHEERRGGDVFHMRRLGARLPEFVVSRVLENVVPIGVLIL